MDELTQYLKFTIKYNKIDLEQILNKKIIITREHIDNINYIYDTFNIILLFKKYGYVFTNDDYILLNNKHGIKYIPEDKKTAEIYKNEVERLKYKL